MAFTEIQALDIEDWMVEPRDLPSTVKSIRNRHGLLFSIPLHGQKRLGLRPDNHTETTCLPSKDGDLGRQVRFFQHGEWALFRSCLRSDVHLLVDIALATGMRWGELGLASTVSDTPGRPRSDPSARAVVDGSARQEQQHNTDDADGFLHGS